MRIDDNIFKQVYVDVTSRCNLTCSWCCNDNLRIKDITVERFEEICKRLPFRVELRLLGGEPTLHPQLFELIKIAKTYKHFPILISNGVKFTDLDYCKELKKLTPMIVSMSMDSAWSDDLKLKALQNFQDINFKRVAITATLFPGKEDIIKDFRRLKEQFPVIRYAHFRSDITDRCSMPMDEIESTVSSVFTELKDPYRVVRDGKSNGCCGSCKLIRPTPDLQVLMLDNSKLQTNNCKERGYVNNEQLTVDYFFREIRRRNRNGS